MILFEILELEKHTKTTKGKLLSRLDRFFSRRARRRRIYICIAEIIYNINSRF